MTRSTATSKAKPAIPIKRNVQKRPAVIPKKQETSVTDIVRKWIGLENLSKLKEENKISDKECQKMVRERIMALVAERKINKLKLEEDGAGNKFLLPDLNLPSVDDTFP